jgi:hypothetical protein
LGLIGEAEADFQTALKLAEQQGNEELKAEMEKAIEEVY